MAIEFNCPNCNAIIRVPDNAAGGRGRCPRCNTRIKVPKTSTPRVAPKQDDLGLELFAPPETDESADIASAPPAEAPAEPQSLEEMFTPKPRALGELPVEPPRTMLRPGSVASKLKRKKSNGGWLIAVACGVILCGASGWYYSQSLLGERLSGELTAETAPVLELKPVDVSASLFNRSPDEMKKFVDELQKSPVRFPSVLMSVQIGGSKKGVRVHLEAGTQTQFYRVEVKDDPAIMKFRSDHGVEFEEKRVAEIEAAGAAFLEEYQRVLDKSANRSALNDFRNSFALPTLVRGFGLNVVAVYELKVYPCVYEDGEGALYFLLPPGAHDFELKGKTNKSGETLFPGNYKVKVTGEMQIPSKGKSDKKSKPEEPEEASGMSKTKDDGEMNEMKKESDDADMKGDMKMDPKPKKKIDSNTNK